MKPCNCGGFWQGICWVHAEGCDRPRNQDFTDVRSVVPKKKATEDDMVARWKSLDERQRDEMLGVPPKEPEKPTDTLANDVSALSVSCLALLERIEHVKPDLIGVSHDVEFAVRMLNRAVARLRGQPI
jgi:hypothetical protein